MATWITDFNTDASCSRMADPDMVFSSIPDWTLAWPLVVVQVTQISMAPGAVWSVDTNTVGIFFDFLPRSFSLVWLELLQHSLYYLGAIMKHVVAMFYFSVCYVYREGLRILFSGTLLKVFIRCKGHLCTSLQLRILWPLSFQFPIIFRLVFCSIPEFWIFCAKNF